MRQFDFVLMSLFVGMIVASCSDKDEVFTPRTFDVQGKVEKGPFVSGSTISIQPMDNKLQVIGSTYNTVISDDLGNFVFGSKEFPTPYAELMANGYFFNEVKGRLSDGTLTLRALADLTNQATVNVNILTHLKYARIKNLVSSGIHFAEANAQAQKELLNAFGLGTYNTKDVSSFSIVSGTDESAAMIAISCLLLIDRSEAAFTEYLSKLSESFGHNGQFSDEILNRIEEDKQKLASKLPDVKENIMNRYDELGISVNVKDLQYYIDWDKDGKAGNEILKEGESVTLDKTSIEVPNEGGTFTVQIESPISLYLEPQLKTESEERNDIIIEDGSLFGTLYDENSIANSNIKCKCEIKRNILSIVISELHSRNNKNITIPLYDYVGNIITTVELSQKGTPYAEVPLLGIGGKNVIKGHAIKMAEALNKYNLIEQYYINNKDAASLRKYVSPGSSIIFNAWSALYSLNANLLSIKKGDEERLNLYEDYFNVFYSIYYSNLIYGWKDIPYVTKISTEASPQESAKNIFSDLKQKLTNAIDNLAEKKNECLKDENGFFFVSKDVARVLLANIYMYEGNYSEALTLLQKVIDNGYYKLDASMNFNPSTTTDDIDVKESSEIILAFLNDNSGSRSSVTVMAPGVIPYITLSDVHLSLAECYYKLEDSKEAEKHIKKVTDAKNLNLSETDVLMKIKEIRERILLYGGTYFAFLKRTGLAKDICNIEDYQLLFPIPENEVLLNYSVKQNPGY